MLKLQPFNRTLPALMGLLILSACGGGGGASDNATTSTTPANALASASVGTVTGFGSVIVDGTEVDDSKATVCAEDLNGAVCDSSVKLSLGQRVKMRLDAKGGASEITVAAGVVGVVTEKSATSFKVAGQLVNINTDASKGPITVFGGTTAAGVSVTSMADIANNDVVGVHGSPVYNAVTKVYEVTATRVEAKSEINHVRVLGKVTGLTATSFKLNGTTIDPSAATIVPTGTTLEEGQTVMVFVPAVNGNVAPTALGWPAKRIHVLKRDLGARDGVAALGGMVGNCNSATACTSFEVGGLTVNASTANITPTGASVKDKAYVRLTGTIAADGSVVASKIHVRQSDTDDDLARVRLMGAIASVDATQNTLIVVRGVPVDTTGAVLKACASNGFVVGNFVDVKAQAQTGTDVVLAKEVRCGPAAEAQAHKGNGHDDEAEAYKAGAVRADNKGWEKYKKHRG